MCVSLQHEAKWTEQAIKFFNEAAEQTGSGHGQTGGSLLSSRQQRDNNDGALLFDLVFEKALDHRSPACSRVHRWGFSRQLCLMPVRLCSTRTPSSCTACRTADATCHLPPASAVESVTAALCAVSMQVSERLNILVCASPHHIHLAAGTPRTTPCCHLTATRVASRPPMLWPSPHPPNLTSQSLPASHSSGVCLLACCLLSLCMFAETGAQMSVNVSRTAVNLVGGACTPGLLAAQGGHMLWHHHPAGTHSTARPTSPSPQGVMPPRTSDTVCWQQLGGGTQAGCVSGKLTWSTPAATGTRVCWERGGGAGAGRVGVLTRQC